MARRAFRPRGLGTLSDWNRLLKEGVCHADSACGRSICFISLKTDEKRIPRFARDDMMEGVP